MNTTLLTFNVRAILWVLSYPQTMLRSTKPTAKQVMHLLIVNLHIATRDWKQLYSKDSKEKFTSNIYARINT